MSSTWRRALPGVANSLKVAFQGFCLGNLISNHMFEIRPSSGSSMLPTLLPKGDYLLLVKLDLLHAWRSASFPALMDSLKSLKRGELVVAAHPIDPEKWVCKRIIGLPGDTVLVEPRSIKQSSSNASLLLLLLSKEIASSPSHPPPSPPPPPPPPPPQYVTIPAGHVWLAGDNTSSSSDSRYYGPVPIALIKGSVVARAFPSPKWMMSTCALKWMD
ncbi:LexA/Signal peptidase [Ceraceosorus guamensis]|uniref:Mitochondrial inner membrane protease subunit n=1 Tax=Ceraceosorus guamensis TaxID=1522189 RepID=A0A316W2C5_9BASI|nr:LexA/Signal peptidase [Ceraceosorus guamensis]PWN43902.1 LexA/Signal peptidase [Ceraceosorus guamensis]